MQIEVHSIREYVVHLTQDDMNLLQSILKEGLKSDRFSVNEKAFASEFLHYTTRI